MSTENKIYKVRKEKLLNEIDNLIDEIEKMRKNKDFSTETQKYLTYLLSSGIRFKRGLADFIEISTVESLKFDRVNIIDIIKSLENNISLTTKLKDIGIDIIYPENVNIFVKGDAKYLGKALENVFLKLIENVQERSKITIKIEAINNYIQINLYNEGISLSIDFSDVKDVIAYHKGNILEEEMNGDIVKVIIQLPILVESDEFVEVVDKDFMIKIIEREDVLPSLSHVAMKVVSIASKEDVTVKQITEVVQNDPSLTARILKVANSSLYSFRRKITTLSQAVSLLGMSAIRNIALCVSVLDSFPTNKVSGFDYRHFWEFSLYSALLCKLTAQKINNKIEEEAFLVGLLQNIGSLIFAKYFPHKYSKIVENSSLDYENIINLEIEEWGIDHQKVGRILIHRWELPEIFSKAVMYHHNPENVPADDSSFSDLIWIVHLSGRMVKALFSSNTELIGNEKKRYKDIFNIEEAEINEIISKVTSEIKEIASNLNIDMDENIDYAKILQKANIELGKINLSIEQANRELKRVIEEKTELANKLKELNKRLERQAITDGLTGIFNHRFFYEVLNKNFAESKRHNYMLSCIMIDIDYFKIFNDTFGHKMGDQILMNVADIIEKSVREEDIVARYGGEEFVALLPQTSKEMALIVAERIRRNVERTAFLEKFSGGEVTVSLGVATYAGYKNWDSGNILVEESDKALYKSKENGRNRVEVI